jgi:hypothetical protein
VNLTSRLSVSLTTQVPSERGSRETSPGRCISFRYGKHSTEHPGVDSVIPH